MKLWSEGDEQSDSIIIDEFRYKFQHFTEISSLIFTVNMRILTYMIQSLCFRKFNFHDRKLFHNRSLPPPHPRKTIFSYNYNASGKFLNLKNRRHLSYLNPLRTVLTTRMLIISINKEIRWNGKATKKEMSEKMFSACEALRFRHVVTQSDDKISIHKQLRAMKKLFYD